MKVSDYPYIIAEIGCNHNGDMDLAKKMIDVAKEKGADAVKFQLWLPDELLTKKYLQELNDGKVKIENIDQWQTKELGLKDIFEQVEKFSIGYEEHIELFDYARKKDIDYLSTSITKEGVDFMIDQKVKFLKLASSDANNLDLLGYAFAKDYPILISLGMTTMDEIERLVKMIPDHVRNKVTLLHCISIYPPKDNTVNVSVIKTLKDTFGINVGYSDHSLGYSITLAAVAYGANIIEKHFTLDKNMPGWDHKVSADPEELGIIVRESKRVYEAVGDGQKTISDDEVEKRKKFRKSIVTARQLTAGTMISEKDITFKRPGTGIGPDEWQKVIGRKLNRDMEEDSTLCWEDIE